MPDVGMLRASSAGAALSDPTLVNPLHYDASVATPESPGLDLVPLVGSRTLKQLGESLGVLALSLGAEDLWRIAAAMPASAVVGTRYDAYPMGHLDSEA